MYYRILGTAALALSFMAGTAIAQASYMDEDFYLNNYCKTTTWNDETTSKSPNIGDCQELVREFYEHKKKGVRLNPPWKYGDKETPYLKIKNFGSCTFGVRVVDTDNDNPAPLAGKDMGDIVNDAIDMFGHDGKIGASGVVPCAPKWMSDKNHHIAWKIYV
ncbi:putative necrosis-inducing factor-domain-containing protein [Xylariaceae sp. FL1019]|nr:putative necrosis-inducing factor-domain-containing protein [Xylariaceae sp. FL1019]